jgi:hypothetical protein
LLDAGLGIGEVDETSHAEVSGTKPEVSKDALGEASSLKIWLAASILRGIRELR